MPEPEYVPRTEAKHGSKCPCGVWIQEGDTIYLLDGEWVCSACYEEWADAE